MILECFKFNEKVPAENAVCRHPDDYCKYRTSCIISFMEKERKREGKTETDNTDKKSVVNTQKKMIELNFSKSKAGLLPAIVQDYKTGEVLMLAYINELAWRKTLETGKAHYWSRSRNKLWLKGESSGHVQLIRDVLVDCDEDTVVFKVEQLGGAACHKGYPSCFFRRVDENKLVIYSNKTFDPEVVYGK